MFPQVRSVWPESPALFQLEGLFIGHVWNSTEPPAKLGGEGPVRHAHAPDAQPDAQREREGPCERRHVQRHGESQQDAESHQTRQSAARGDGAQFQETV